MDAELFKIVAALKVENCCNCHMGYAVPTSFQDARREDHKTFFCPAGHGQSYISKTEKEKTIDELSKELNRKTGLIINLESKLTCKKNLLRQKDYSVRAYKGMVTKLKRGK